MTQCEECIARRAAVDSSTELLRDKAFKYRDQPGHVKPRLLGDAKHQLQQALTNLANHEAECRGRQL